MNASTDLMHTLAWSLLHFLWQGVAIAALAAAVMFVFRAPATRYLVGVASIALMFVSFGVTFASLNSAASDVAAAGAATPAYVPASPAVASDYPLSRPVAAVAIARRTRLGGADLASGRLSAGAPGGVWPAVPRAPAPSQPHRPARCLRRAMAEAAAAAGHRACRQVLRMPAGLGSRGDRLVSSDRVAADARTDRTLADQLEAVIAHELGHIKRFDIAVNFFQVIAETLFFFHPAVWWLNKRIRADREDCCDDMAIAVCGERAGYARALATMEGWRDVPDFALAATGGSVAARVARLLGISEQNTTTRTAGVFTATLVLTAALSAGAISLGMVEPAEASGYIGAEPVLLAQADAQPAPSGRPRRSPTPHRSPIRRQSRAPHQIRRTTACEQPYQCEHSPRNSYIAQMKAAGYDDLDVDQLVAMRVHGITPEYVKGVRDMGFSPDPDQVVALKVHDVTPEYVKSIRDMGFGGDVDQIVAMKVHDITPEYVQEIRAMGFKPDADEIIAMKVHDITPDYVKQMRALGFEPNADELIALKVHEVTAEYRDELAAAGYKLDVEEIIEAKVMDITTEFIEEVHAHGFKDLSMEQLIQLKNADVL